MNFKPGGNTMYMMQATSYLKNRSA